MSGTGLVVVLAVLVVATVVGMILRARSGRVRETASPAGTVPGTTPATSPDGWVLTGTAPAEGERVLLLQLSSPICTPCRQTAGMLGELAAARPAVRHVEIDVADRPEVARELSVMRTPTTIGFDHTGRELLRVSGVPRRAELDEALGRAGA
ncbi:thioredoxin family protein [Pseudonocardia ailaonensis]|uniref:Thioredoxin family protein n=1 Tax=Pseudonocardia ailaonensis TaxID=367279 RepID=A0ABN2MVM3_9PSEU